MPSKPSKPPKPPGPPGPPGPPAGRRAIRPDRLPALIPVRGGSREIPRKNLRELGGVSLLARAIRTAREARRIERVLVSTDSEEMAVIARREGAEVPALRPARLARDDTLVSEVIRHAWSAWIAPSGGCDGDGDGDCDRESDAERPGGLVLVQATSPFLRPATIDRAVETFRRSGAAVLKAVRRVREHPRWMLRPEGDMLVSYLEVEPGRRQDLPTLYLPCGAVYVYSPEHIEKPDARAPAAWIEVGWPESLDIDSPEDLETAAAIEARLAGPPEPEPAASRRARS